MKILKKANLYFRNVNILKIYQNVKNFSTIEDKTIDSEVLIVGGGVPGLSLAAALLKSNYFKFNDEKESDIILIDQPQRIKDNFTYTVDRIPDMRVVSLTPASIRFLKSIGAWDFVDERLVRYVKGMQVYENKGSSFINMHVSDNQSVSTIKSFIPFLDSNNDYICAVVEINHIIHALTKAINGRIKVVNQALEYDNIDLNSNEEYAYLDVNDNNNKTKYRSKVIVASDGARSVIRNKLKISTSGYDYNETGLVATLKGNKSSDIAYQRFLHNGIFALLPLYDNLYSIVCSMPKNINENLKKLDDKSFIDVVNQILHNSSEFDFSQLDRLTFSNNFSSPPVITEILSKRMEFPLQLQYVSDPVYKNFALIGDAGHSIHPMAGQGLNLGIADSSLLANEIVNSKQLGRRINDKRTLENFSFKSQMNSKTMITTMEALKMSYLPTNYLVSGIRNLGMSVFNKSSFIKSIFMTAASGDVFQPKKFAWE